MTDWLSGRLNAGVTPFDELFADPTVSDAVGSGAAFILIVGVAGSFWLITRYRWWGPLWRDWLTSTDHKKIGIMYIVLALVMMARAVLEGIVMRAHQATALGGGMLSPDHFAQLFSTHGTIMVFFVGMPMIVGLINYVVPLQIGARDMAFPVMNQISLGLTTAGAALVMISLVIGTFETGGWSAYPPYTGSVFSPGPGPDYWIWAVLISGIGSTLSGINFAVTIYKMRAPGMTYMRMPMFTWTSLCTAIMMIYAFPPLTAAAGMLALDRYAGFHFFTNDLGGNVMNYPNLFWMFGHPEVYILVLPAYGVFSEISSTFSAKSLYGYRSLVLATMCIAVVSFTVWLHHFFTMGQSAQVNAAFGIATMVIAVPTGIKVYDWMATMFRGRIRLTVPMIYLTGFFFLFVLGGLTGVLLANPTISYQVHNTLFLVAHFHNVLIPGTLFGLLAGIHYWFPKAFGFRLDEPLARRTAYLWIVGFSLTFLPLYWLGLLGMPRRSARFSNPDFDPWMFVAAAGAVVIFAAGFTMFQTIWVSIRNRAALAVPVGDPWDGRTLEWALPAPVPAWNFAATPLIHARDAFAAEKSGGRAYQAIDNDDYADVVETRNTPVGLIMSAAFTALGFALVWWIWWLAVLAVVTIVATVIHRAFNTQTTVTIPASELARARSDWLAMIGQTRAVMRDEELLPANRGLAAPDRVRP